MNNKLYNRHTAYTPNIVLQRTLILATFWLIFGILPATAQFDLNDPTMQRAQQILPKAFSCYTRKQHDSAIVYLRKILDLKPPVSPLLSAYIYYHIGANLCLLGQKDKSLAAFTKAVEGGFAERDEMAENTDLIPLRTLPQFDSILVKAEANANALKLYNITRWDNSGLGFAPIHLFDSWTNERLQQLRKKYQLDTLRTPERTELDVQIAALSWVHHRWKHNPLNIAFRPDALDILDSAAAGATYRCAEYAEVLCQVLQALGYPARVVELHSKGVSFGIAKAHVATEVWNNDLRKWIYLDAQTNAMWKHGITLLNSSEIRDMIIDKHLDSLEMYAFPSRWLSHEQIKPSEWLRYFHYLFFRLENRYCERPESVLGLAPLCYLRRDQTPELLYQGMPRALESTMSSNKIYPPMNVVHADIIGVSVTKPLIDIRFTQAVPSFSYYHITANGGISIQFSELFSWHIQHGNNTLVVRGVNQAGVMGPPMTIELEYAAK